MAVEPVVETSEVVARLEEPAVSKALALSTCVVLMGVGSAALLLSGAEPTTRRAQPLVLLEPFAPWSYYALGAGFVAVAVAFLARTIRASRTAALWTEAGAVRVPQASRTRVVRWQDIKSVSVRQSEFHGVERSMLVIRRRGRRRLKVLGRLDGQVWDDVAVNLSDWMVKQSLQALSDTAEL